MQILRFDTNCQNKFIKSHLKNCYHMPFEKFICETISPTYFLFPSLFNILLLSQSCDKLVIRYRVSFSITSPLAWFSTCICGISGAYMLTSAPARLRWTSTLMLRERNIVLNHLEQCIYKNWGHPDHQTKYRTELKQQSLPPI